MEVSTQIYLVWFRASARNWKWTRYCILGTADTRFPVRQNASAGRRVQSRNQPFRPADRIKNEVQVASGTFAVAYTVKNEARLLPSAIQYHLAAGASRIYLHWDGTTDGSERLISQFPSVVARDSYKPQEMSDAPQWLAQILPAYDVDFDVRKRANTYYAALQAAKEGIEWLACIDVDELVLMATNEHEIKDHIPKYLSQIPDRIDQLLLPNLEAVPTSVDTQNPFADCVYFLNRFPATEAIWRYSRALFTRIARSPAAVAWYDYFFYKLRFAGALPRKFRDPNTGKLIPAGYFIGYSTYKSIIRVKSFPQFNFVTHCAKPFLRAPRNLRTGNVLHYDLPDAAYFASKFRQREGVLHNHFYLRYRLALVALNSTDDQIQQFFDNYLALRDPARIALLKRKGILLEIDAVSELIRQFRDEASAALA